MWSIFSTKRISTIKWVDYFIQHKLFGTIYVYVFTKPVEKFGKTQKLLYKLSKNNGKTCSLLLPFISYKRIVFVIDTDFSLPTHVNLLIYTDGSHVGV